MKIQFLGTGDAFGSGGRLQTCIYAESHTTRFLIDCGTSCLIGMKRFDIDPLNIDIIILSHLHGDHFGGIPFIIRETQIIASRVKPLIIAGPTGLKEALTNVMEAFFPGSNNKALNFPIEFIELTPNSACSISPLTITPYPAVHTPGANPLSLRVQCNDKVIAYSGDTEWTDTLIDVSRDADIFICECFSYEKKIKNHMDYMTIMENSNKLECRRLILTHMNNSMLEMIQCLDLECANDGDCIVI